MTPLPLADLERVGASRCRIGTPLPLTALPKYLASQRFTLEKLEAVMNKSLSAIKDVVWALNPAGAACPACGAGPAAAEGGGDG